MWRPNTRSHHDSTFLRVGLPSQWSRQMHLSWQNVNDLPSRSFKCGHCGNALASEKGWYAYGPDGGRHGYVYLCHYCTKPTFFDSDGTQWPGVAFGSSVKDIPDRSVVELYEEARRATSAGSYTAAVLCCRKLLMHIAVSKGAPVGKSPRATCSIL